MIPLPQELIDEVMDNLSRNADVKICTLMGGSWGYPARKRLFHHVRVSPEGIQGWLSRPPESVQRMAPHIVKFELADYRRSPSAPPFCWEDTESLLTRLISPLALSPLQWLRIESFGIDGFSKATLEQCFEPISHSLHALELGNLTMCPDATKYLISLFPHLNDLYVGGVEPMPTLPALEWADCGVKYSPKLSGTLRFSTTTNRDNSGLFLRIASLSPRFRVFSPGVITNSNWDAVQELIEVCAETVESVPLAWWSRAGMRVVSVCDLTFLTAVTVGCVPPNFLSSCKKLRKVGFAPWGRFEGTEIQTALSSITSKHLSTVSLYLSPTAWSRSNDNREEFRQWWDDLENTLCRLADRCLANGRSLLVLEMVWWRPFGHLGDCGTTHPDTIMQKFREKGLIRFVEGDISNCKRCADILGYGSQASGGS